MFKYLINNESLKTIVPRLCGISGVSSNDILDCERKYHLGTDIISANLTNGRKLEYNTDTGKLTVWSNDSYVSRNIDSPLANKKTLNELRRLICGLYRESYHGSVVKQFMFLDQEIVTISNKKYLIQINTFNGDINYTLLNK